VIQKQLRVLVTGGLGFLGLAVARRFKADGCSVYGIGRGIPSSIPSSIYEKWIAGDISAESLHQLDVDFDVVVHCAGPSSVGKSLLNPIETLESSVLTTLKVLEYLKKVAPGAILIHASSAAVYGAAADRPLNVRDPPNPVSPYGYYKWMAELLLKSYAESFGIKYVAIRFFSIYGVGLRRQLLWDASCKLMAGDSVTTFWGTGQETRDWINVDDATDLIASLAASPPNDICLINGASGVRMTVEYALRQLHQALGSTTKIVFSGETRLGDPAYYHADMTEVINLGWNPKVNFSEAILDYAKWFKEVG
jgi:UDP-glucose 4-epimerase